MTGLRIGGLASGMDIDSLVEKLMTAERIPLDKLTQKKTTTEWQRDAYRSINTKLSTFSTYLFDNFMLASNFNKKTVTSSNSNLISATATSAATGNLSLEGVSQLATAARQVGDTVSTSGGGIVTGSTKMSELKNAVGDTTISLKAIQADGTLAKEATKIEIKSSDTIDQVVSKINSSNAGVSALFENGKLSITAKNTGDIKGEAEVQVNAGSGVFTALGMKDPLNLASDGTNAIFQVNGISTERSTNTFTLSGYTVTLNSTFNVKNTLTEQIKRLETAKTQADNDVIAAQTSQTNANTAQATAQGVYTLAYNALRSDLQTSYDSIKTSTSFKNTLANLSEEGLAKYQVLSTLENEDIDASDLTTEQKTILKNLSVDERNTLKNLSSTDFSALKGVAEKEIQLETSNTNATIASNNLTLKIATRNQIIVEYDATVLKNNNTTQDASVASVQLTATADIDSMVDKVKEFVDKYNELITGMNDSVKEKKYRDYAPLSDEQRKDMSEAEQKLWDEKARSGLLRSDSIVSSGLLDMRNAIYGRVGSGTNVIDTLAEMGITTSSVYSDGGKLVIDEKKLRVSLTENPDKVVQTLTHSGTKATNTTEDTRGIIQRLRDSMTDFTRKIETKAGKVSSTDQQYTLGKSLIDMNNRITAFQRRLEDVESRYWKQFTAMETAINKANSQSSYLSGFGQQ